MSKPCAVLRSHTALPALEIARILADLPKAFERVENELRPLFLHQTVEVLPDRETFRECLLELQVSGELSPDAHADAVFLRLLSADDPAFRDFARRSVSLLEPNAETGVPVLHRYELGADREEPSAGLARLNEIAKRTSGLVERSWEVTLKAPPAGGGVAEEARTMAAGAALYRAIHAANLPGAPYHLALRLNPTLPHGLQAFGQLVPSGKRDLLVANARAGLNTVSVVVRPLPNAHQLFLIGTHALDASFFSRELGVELVAAKD